ncbi:MAG: hypothetical protein AB1938_18700 [Myxococcota bacterium]
MPISCRALPLGVLACASVALADSPLTSTDFHTAYRDVRAVQAAEAKDLDATYTFLASDAPNDQKLAAANALGWEGDYASGFVTHLAKSKGVPESALDAKALTASQRFVLGYLAALADYFEMKPLEPGAKGVRGARPLTLLQSAAKALPDDFSVQYALALVQAQAAMNSSWCEVFQIPDAVVKRFPAAKRNLRPGALESAAGYLAAYEESCAGSKAAQRVKKDELNQVYTLSKLGRQVVAGTQGGVVVWDPDSPEPVAVHEGFICRGVTVGAAVWLGCEAEVLRWDGTAFTSFLPRSAKNSAVYYQPMVGPDGTPWVRLGKKTWAFDAGKQAFAPVQPPWKGDPYDAVFFQGRAYWIDFLQAVHSEGRVFAKGSAGYPGTDPRRLRIDSAGQLWVEDFESGLFRFVGERFVKHPGLDTKASGVLVDVARGRKWLLRYTQGLVLQPAGAPDVAIDLPELQFMRDLLLDESSGDVWVAGWTEVVRLKQDGKSWARQRFRVK